MQRSDSEKTRPGARLWPVLYAVPPLAWAGVIFWLSSIPSSGYAGTSHYFDWLPWYSYFIHGGLYFVLGGLTVRLLYRVKVRFPWLTAAQLAVLIVTLYGLSDEYHQTFVAGRDFSLLDLTADFLGASCAAAAWAVWSRAWSGWRARRA